MGTSFTNLSHFHHSCIPLILTPVAGEGIQQDESCMDLVFVQAEPPDSWFMATIPVHPVFLNDTVNDTENDTENDTVVFAELPKRQQDVLVSIHENDRITESQMSQKFSVSRSTISRATTSLKERKIIIRIGSDRSGSWMIVKKVKGL